MQSTLIIFTASWCETCCYTNSMWVSFANRFSTEKVKFIEVDTVRFNDVAKEFKVNPNDGNQLPSLVLLEDNVEALRFPPINFETLRVAKTINFKEKDLLEYFDLQKRFLATSSKADTAVKKKAKV